VILLVIHLPARRPQPSLPLRRRNEQLMLGSIQLQSLGQKLDCGATRGSANAPLKLADFLRVETGSLSKLLLSQASGAAVPAQNRAK